MTDKNIYNILDYGAVSCAEDREGGPIEGATLSTQAIQKAIDLCSESGGRVVIPAGRYVSGSIRLKSNVELYLENNSILMADHHQESMMDFAKDFEDDNEATGWVGGCFIYAKDAENIAIRGTGMIDGQGRRYFYDDEPDEGFHESPLNVCGLRPRLTYLENIRNLSVESVTFYDAAYWTLHMAGCSNVMIDGIRILNERRGANTDGIDPDSCHNVIIRNCLIECGDDCVVIKSTAPSFEKYGDCENIVISSCIMHSHSSAIKIGTETYGDIHHVIVSDCVLENCSRGIGIWSRDGGRVYDVNIHHVTGTTRQYLGYEGRKEFNPGYPEDRDFIDSWWGKGEPFVITATKRKDCDRIPGKISGIFADHLTIDAEGCITIAGEEYSPIEDVIIDDSRIMYRSISGHPVKYIDEQPSEHGSYERKVPYAYVRFGKNIKINSEFKVDGDLKGVIAEEIVNESPL